MWGIPGWLLRLIFLPVDYGIITEMLSLDMQDTKKKKKVPKNFKKYVELFMLVVQESGALFAAVVFVLAIKPLLLLTLLILCHQRITT